MEKERSICCKALIMWEYYCAGVYKGYCGMCDKLCGSKQ